MATAADPRRKQVRNALILCAALTIVFAAAAAVAFARGDEEVQPFSFGAALGVLGIALLVRRGRQLRDAPELPVPGPSAEPPRPLRLDPSPPPPPSRGMTLEEAFSRHFAELEGLPSGEERGRITFIWQEEMNEHAHDYLDLLTTLPDEVTNQVFEQHAGAIIHAYLAGYMARRGWIDEVEALQAPFRFGRRLRDELRALGLPMENLRSSFAVVMNRTLEKITRAGISEA